MDNRQLAYLKALGITPWRIRTQEAELENNASNSLGNNIDKKIVRNVESGEPVTAQPDASGCPAVTQSAALSSEYGVHVYSWEQLRGAVSGCYACDLHTTRTQTVFGVGDHQAKLMIIGEAPGADEDRQGEPFVGRAGQLLNQMLLAIGLKREEVFIANILKCRPPNNRDPRPEEVAKCEPYLKRQVQLVNPKIILAVGRIAAHNLLKVDTPLSRLRGKNFQYGDSNTPVVITYHPAYLLRSPKEKRKAWQDLLVAKSMLQS